MIEKILDLLKNNAEWMSSIALVIFAFMQWWIMCSQFKQELRIQRMKLAEILSKEFTMFDGSSKSATNILKVMAQQQSNFLFLLNDKDCEKVTDLFKFLTNLRFSNEKISQELLYDRIIKANDYVEKVEYALVNATYNIDKKVNPNKKGFSNQNN